MDVALNARPSPSHLLGKPICSADGAQISLLFNPGPFPLVFKHARVFLVLKNKKSPLIPCPPSRHQFFPFTAQIHPPDFSSAFKWKYPWSKIRTISFFTNYSGHFSELIFLDLSAAFNTEDDSVFFISFLSFHDITLS